VSADGEESLLGKVGRVTVSIPADGPGEVLLAVQNRMQVLVGRVFAGHLRSIIGGLTVEQIIRERDRVAQEIKDGSHAEMEKLGIVVDALEIQEIDDSSGYINNLAAPHAAAVASLARIAKAKADQEAAERELQWRA
jgi:flotillin